VTISRPIRNNQTLSPLTTPSAEAKVNTDKPAHDPVVKETVKSPPSLSPEEAKREAARGLAKLNRANRDLPEATKQAGSGNAQFREKFANLLKNNKHITVPFGRLSPNMQQIALEELSRREVAQHLEKVKLDMSRNSNVPLQDTLSAIEAMSQHGGQKLEIDLDLSETNIGDENFAAQANRLLQGKVSSLNLSKTGIGKQSAIAIAKALPTSPITVLNLDRNEIDADGLKALADTLPESRLTSLSLAFNRVTK